jgi:dolichol-phosphate mannosyltransferase
VFPKLIEKWEQGSEVVHTKRLETEGEPFFKRLMSNLFYKVVNMFSEVKMEEGMADFKLLDKKVLEKIKTMKEHNRFLRGMVPWLGFKSSVVVFKAKQRIHGKPWYNFRRNLSFAKSGILAFSVKPLKYIGYLGLFLTTFSLIIVVAVVIRRLIMGGWFLSPIFLIGLFNTFLMGLVLSSLGIIALYIHYIYFEVLNRPLYIVADKTFKDGRK